MSKKITLCLIFFFFSPAVIFSLFLMTDIFGRNRVLGEAVSGLPRTEVMFASLPEASGIVASSIKSEDSTAVMIEKYLKRYNSPLLPYRDVFLESAEKYNVDPKLIVAIAQQESNLGKSSPEDCHNAWGWGIHSRGTKCYEHWPEAIESVTKGIAVGYCSKGLCDDPCEMMKKYTPRSNGSWCAGVKQFLSEMETGDF